MKVRPDGQLSLIVTAVHRESRGSQTMHTQTQKLFINHSNILEANLEKKFHILSMAIITKQPGLSTAQQLWLLNGLKCNSTSSELQTQNFEATMAGMTCNGEHHRGNYNCHNTCKCRVRTFPCTALGDTNTREAQRKDDMKGIIRMVTGTGKTL